MNQLQLDILDALENGNHTQIRGQLKDGDCFCAEGVICDVLAKHQLGFWDENVFKYKTREGVDPTRLASSTLTLPNNADFGSLTYDDFLLPFGTGESTVKTPLYFFNDTLKLSLEDIGSQLRLKWSSDETDPS